MRRCQKADKKNSVFARFSQNKVLCDVKKFVGRWATKEKPCTQAGISGEVSGACLGMLWGASRGQLGASWVHLGASIKNVKIITIFRYKQN